MATVNKNFIVKNGIQAGSTIFAPTATTAIASLNLPHGVAPSSPNNGDIWTTTTGFFTRINGATLSYVDLSTTQTITGSKTFSGRTHFTNAVHLYVNGSDPGSPETGDIYYNDSSLIYKYYNGSAWRTLADLESTQTFTATKSFTSGTLNLNPSSGNAYFNISSAAATERYVRFQTAGSTRWTFGATPANETGSNTGSDFSIARWTDAGAWIDNPININRSTGNVSIGTGSLELVGASSGAADASIHITTNAGYARKLSFNTVDAAHPRWLIWTTNEAESTGNLGSNLEIRAYNDNGSYFGAPVKFWRDDLVSQFGGGIYAAASTTTMASLNIPAGTAPTSPTNGDIWTTTSGIFARINSVTRNLIEQTIPFTQTGTIATGTGKARLYIERAGTITGVRTSVNTAPTGASLIVDVNKNGTTIFTTQGNRPTIAASAFTSGLVSNMDVTTVAAGDYITVDVDQIGSTVAGADLVVTIYLAT